MSGEHVDIWWAEGDRRTVLRAVLARQAGGRPRFSVAASGSTVVVAITTERAVGVDVELVAHATGLEEAGALFLTPEDQRAIAALDGEDRPRELLRQWTLQEALAKATGTGLTGEAVAIEHPWRGETLPTAPGVIASLVVLGGWATCRQRRLPQLGRQAPAPWLAKP
jgi:4'-phosphopantetheinyl transferase superfamily